MGSCFSKLFKGKGERRHGYERATRNAEDAFDSDSDTEVGLLDGPESETRTDRSGSNTAAAGSIPRLQIDGEYHDDDEASDEEDGAGAPSRPGVDNADITPYTLDALAAAAQRVNLSSLAPDLDTPVPKNTPAEGNLLDL